MRFIATEQRRGVAETYFVNAAFEALPREARASLLRIRGDSGFEAWTRKWHVAAPACVRRARELQATFAVLNSEQRKQFVEGSVVVSRGFWPPPPPAWREEMIRMSRMTNGRQTLAEKVAPGYLGTYRKTQLADDPDFLGGLAADPAIETLEHFRERAVDHFEARARRLQAVGKQHGFTTRPMKHSPQVAQHASWLVRFQLKGESPADIAVDEGFHHDRGAETISKAIHEMAALIELRLRQVRRGRPKRATRIPTSRRSE